MEDQEKIQSTDVVVGSLRARAPGAARRRRPGAQWQDHALKLRKLLRHGLDHLRKDVVLGRVGHHHRRLCEGMGGDRDGA